MTLRAALRFIDSQGIVLEAARGPVPSLLDHALGRRVVGSWWGDPDGKAFFALTQRVRRSADVLVCRLVAGKITYVHRRLWPALACLQKEIGVRRLAAVREEHTASGAHQTYTTPFIRRIGSDARAAAKRCRKDEAREALAQWRAVLWQRQT